MSRKIRDNSRNIKATERPTIFGNISKGGAKVLVDPTTMLGSNREERLGPNLIINGDFHDFTMDNDSDVKGHWILDGVYNSDKGDTPIPFQNWSEGLSALGAEKITNSTDWTDTNEDGVPDDWSINPTYSGVGFVMTDGANGFTGSYWRIVQTHATLLIFEQAGLAIDQTTCGVIKFKYRCSSGAYLRLRADSGHTLQEWNGNEGEAITVSAVFYNYGTNNSLYFGLAGSPNDWVEIDDVSLTTITGTKHLQCINSEDLWGADQENLIELSGANPAYMNGNALTFNGTDQYLILHEDETTDFDPGTDDITIEAWVKTPNTAGYKDIYNNTYSPSGYLRFFITDGGGIRINLYDGTNLGNLIGSAVDDDEWHHVAAVIDRDVGVYLYIDGVLDNSEETSEWTIMSGVEFSVSSDINIGKLIDYFSGQIAEVRYSATARTQQEIQESYGRARYWESVNDPAAFTESRELGVQVVDERGGESSGAVRQLGGLLTTRGFYKISLDMKSFSGSSNVSIYFNSAYVRPVSQLTNTDWQHFEYYYQATSTSSQLAIYTYTSVNIFFRNVKVQKVLGYGEVVSNFVENLAYKGARWEDNNDINNPSADTTIVPWTDQGDATVLRQTGDYHSAPACIQGVTISGGTSNFIRSFTPENTYAGEYGLYSFWAKYAAGNTDLSFWNQASWTESITSDWRKYIVFSEHYTTTQARWGLDGAGTFRLDDVHYKKLNPASGFHGKGMSQIGGNQPKHPYAISFNGTDHYVQFGVNQVIGTEDCILFAWIYGDMTTAAYRAIWSHYRNTSLSWQFRVNGNDLFWWSEYGGGNETTIYTSNNCLANDDQWYFVACVHNRDNWTKFYVDMVEQPNSGGSDSDLPSADDYGDSNWSGSLGVNLGRGYNGSNFWDGKIGVTGIYRFDGVRGTSSLPSNYEEILRRIYSSTKNRYWTNDS
jgi:hypothetical protein